MKATRIKLLAIILVALLFRLSLLPLIQNPGLHDPVHYFNLGRRLSQGQGFTIDYIWHYSHIPAEIVHPIDHWMPMTGIAAAMGIGLGGVTPQAALTVFILIGSLIPILTFLAGKQLNLPDDDALIPALFAAFLPDIVWNSLRTDTTILNMAFIGVAFLLLRDGLQNWRKISFVFCGAFVGFAYLTRNDSLLFFPTLILVLALFSQQTTQALRLRSLSGAFALITLAFLVVVVPWLWRNQQELGLWGTAETSHMFFMVEQADHYAYGIPISLESMLQRQTFTELAAKRLFEFAAALKQIAVSLELPLILLVPAGVFWLFRKREASPPVLSGAPLIWLLGTVLVYPLLLPLKSQAGSFEKAFLSIVPLLLPFSALAINKLLKRQFLKWSVVVITTFYLMLSSHTLVKRETEFANRYYASMRVLVDELESLPDLTGDGEKRLMSQDTFALSYLGYPSVIIPLASREDTLELASRYAIDYLMLPAGRPSLDPLYLGAETDERFQLVARLTDAGEKPFELYRFAQVE